MEQMIMSAYHPTILAAFNPLFFFYGPQPHCFGSLLPLSLASLFPDAAGSCFQ